MTPGFRSFGAARTVLLIPDLVGYWLSGVQLTELTNASTTGLLDVHRRTWDTELMTSLAIPPTLFAPLGAPGDVVGPLRDAVRQQTGAPAEIVINPAISLRPKYGVQLIVVRRS